MHFNTSTTKMSMSLIPRITAIKDIHLLKMLSIYMESGYSKKTRTE